MHLSRCHTAALLLSLGVLAPSRAWATDFYVDPATGSMSNDGSATKPWKTLEEVVAANLIESQIWGKLPYADGATLVPKNAGAPVKAGDTVWLRSGYHGTVELKGYYNAGLITIAAVPGDEPRLARISLTAGQNWALRGLSLSPSYAPTYDASKALIILASDGYLGPASDVTVEGCFAESVPDTSAWSGDDWLTKPADGITASGRHHLITGNTFHNVRFGIAVTASETTVERNTVNSFGNGDGMRGLGDDSVFQYNIVKNAHHPDPIPSNGNHDDAFQSWSLGVDPADGKTKAGFGVVKNITIRGNLFLSHEDLDPPFKSEFQGVGCFDGMYDGFVVENNVIISSTYHGIALYGATNSRIVNNTVIYRHQGDKGVPWIKIDDHKNGTPSTGNLVRNNLVTALAITSKGVTEDHTILLSNPAQFFVNQAGFDLHLLPGAPAIDQGSSEQAPTIDADGVPRPQGAAVDVGAYEWHAGASAGSGGSGQAGSGASGQSGKGQSGNGQAGQGQAGSAAGGSSSGGSTAGGAGGKPGTGGSAAGGKGAAAGSGQASGTAGSAGKPAGSGGAAGMGGASVGTSGAGTGGVAASPTDAADDGGCGCHLPGKTAPGGAASLAALLLLMRRRRR